MRLRAVNPLMTTLTCLAVLMCGPAQAQQFSSDNYLSKPHGVATIILTAGERNDMFMTTFSLFRNWEFTAAAYTYHSADRTVDEGYSTSYYVKWMLYENKAKTGGLAVKFGTGMEPGYLGAYGLEDAFKTFWVNAPMTVPMFDNKLSWDIMPGASITYDYGPEEVTAAAFTYTTRLAWYPVSPKWSIVGEVYGSEGEVRAIPEYRVGLRWEPSQHAVVAVTYDDEFNGTNGGGFEIGVMLFTNPFACFKGCK